MKNSPAFVFFFLGMVLGAIPQSPPPGTPSWALVEMGDYHLEKRDFARAVIFYREALGRRGSYPEASVAMGQAFGANGQYVLFDRYLEQSESTMEDFLIPESRIRLWYTYANILLLDFPGQPNRENRVEDWKKTMERILMEDEFYGQLGDPEGRERLNEAFFTQEEGKSDLDWLLTLYEGGNPAAIRAHQLLSDFYLEENSPQMALNHALFALIEIFTVVRVEYRSIRPDFSFETIETLFTDLGESRIFSQDIRQFISEIRLMDTLITLALALEQIDDRPVSASEGSLVLLSTQEVYQRIIEKIRFLMDFWPEIGTGSSPLVLQGW